MLISLDIETACAVPTCEGFREWKKCEHALCHKTNSITNIGLYWEEANEPRTHLCKTATDLYTFLSGLMVPPTFIGQNLKFDVKTLWEKEPRLKSILSFDTWEGDTYCQAIAYSHKISEAWMEEYRKKRKELNKLAGKALYRDAGPLSLKTMAPYYLGVEAFWETGSLSEDEYVLKDCEYTYKLYRFFQTALKQDGTENFYKEKLMPWMKMLTRMEIWGTPIHVPTFEKLWKETEEKRDSLATQVHNQWKEAFTAYKLMKQKEVWEDFSDKQAERLTKASKTKLWEKLSQEKRREKQAQITEKLEAQYRTREAKIEEFNLNSPSQLVWLFRDHMGLNIRIEGEETTGKAFLEKMILEGREDIKIFSEWRKADKLLSGFFEAYAKEKIVEGRIYPSFNLGGTKTGRLSSNGPNFQQIPPLLKQCIKAPEGKKLIYFDLSGIEPVIIAYMTEDPRICGALQQGISFHCLCVKDMLEEVTCDYKEVKGLYKKERDAIKQCDLSLLYGSGKNRLRTTMYNHGFKWDQEKCAHTVRTFKQKFKQVFEFKKDLDAALERGEPVVNLMGRKFRIEDPTEVYMTGFNRLIQGSGSDLMVESAKRFVDYLDAEQIKDCFPFGLVHDSIVIEAAEDKVEHLAQKVYQFMTSYTLNTIHGVLPLEAEGGVSDSWKDM